METQTTLCFREQVVTAHGRELMDIVKPFGALGVNSDIDRLGSLDKEKNHLCLLQSPHRKFAINALVVAQRLRIRLRERVHPLVFIHPRMSDVRPLEPGEGIPLEDYLRPQKLQCGLEEMGVEVCLYEREEEIVDFVRDNIQRLWETASKN